MALVKTVLTVTIFSDRPIDPPMNPRDLSGELQRIHFDGTVLVDETETITDPDEIRAVIANELLSALNPTEFFEED